MKKKILSMVMVIIFLLITGCKEKQIKELSTSISKDINIKEDGAKLICTTDYDYTELNYTLGSKYVVFADEDGKVTKIISEEIIESTDESKLEEFESYLNKNHDVAVQYKGYTYDVKKEDNKVISDVTIDYSEFDAKKFISENDLEDSIKELTIDSIEKKYIALGATCNKK